MFHPIDAKLYEKVQTIKRLSLELSSPFNYKVINTSMIGEIEACNAMGWSIAIRNNNPGVDAVNEYGRSIQIKTFVEGLKTRMLPHLTHRIGKIKMSIFWQLLFLTYS
jgi:hypothetical protein